ncbi:MAG: hypothetical protein ABJ360_03400, partial [Roseobacter sp.]
VGSPTSVLGQISAHTSLFSRAFASNSSAVGTIGVLLCQMWRNIGISSVGTRSLSVAHLRVRDE